MFLNNSYDDNLISNLNKDINNFFPHLFPIQKDYTQTQEGISRLVMLDRYSQKDTSHKTLKISDLVVVITKDDSMFPSRGIGKIVSIDKNKIGIQIEEEYFPSLTEEEIENKGIIYRDKNKVEKPLEIFWEQICMRLANHLSKYEVSLEKQKIAFDKFYSCLNNQEFIPAGRVLFGAGSGHNVTYFNCYVLPFVPDSRGGISDHRKCVMEIMSRGGGVGSNGSTLRPHYAAAKSVGGKSSGTVSWLGDLAALTHLVEQGGSRRGAQMIMLADWHPDIIEFIVSKMQNPKILKWLAINSKDEKIREEAKKKIKFTPLDSLKREMYQQILKTKDLYSDAIYKLAENSLFEGGEWNIVNPQFLTGANISVTLSKPFMDAVEHDLNWDLKFPDIDSYNEKEKADYDNLWNNIGDVFEWEKLGYRTKTYYTIKAKHLWDLINFCSTYSAEPGVFFIDTANKYTNARAYGQKVIATNPCGEQPLAPYSVCNLGAINLAQFVNKYTGEVLFDKLKEKVKIATRFLDNVIDATYYFLEENKKQAKGERRIGLGIMGLHDLLIWAKVRYGSKESIELSSKIIKTIAISAYEESVELAKEKGSFAFLTDRQKFIETGYMKKMPEDLKEKILKFGIRNSHLLTIAPTGSTGTLIGGSTGLEPHYAFSYFRSGRLGKFIKVESKIVEQYKKIFPEYIDKKLPDFFVSAVELTPEEHTSMQIAMQEWVDSSISKTVNAPRGYSVQDVQKIYMNLYKHDAKGGTVYVDGSRDAQVLSLSNENEEDNVKEISLEDFGVVISDKNEAKNHEQKKDIIGNSSADRQDRKIGDEIGDLCPICKEGVVEDIGGCNSCTTCGTQLKCGL